MNRTAEKLHQLFSNNIGILCLIVFIFVVLFYFISSTMEETSLISKNNDKLFNRDVGVSNIQVSEFGVEFNLINNKPVEINLINVKIDNVDCMVQYKNLYVKKRTYVECEVFPDNNQDFVNYTFTIDYVDRSTDAKYSLGDLNLISKVKR